MSDDDNVVLLPGIKDGIDRHELVPEFRRRKPGECRHHQRRAVIDHDLHRLVCKQCDGELDPIDWLKRIAWDWETVADQLARARKDAAAAQTRLDSLLRRIKNARGRQQRLPAQQQLEVLLLGCVGKDGHLDWLRFREVADQVMALVIALSAQAVAQDEQP